MSETKNLMERKQNNLNEEVEAEILRMYKADEHKQDTRGIIYTYLNIETDLLGDFYISFDIDQNKINTDGYPWEFLTKEEYQLTPEQKEFYKICDYFIKKDLIKYDKN